VVLESGGYGRVSIDKSVTITAPSGVYAGITVFPGENGIDIVGFGLNVALRGITINGQGGDHGIVYTAGGGSLTIDRCSVANMSQDGMRITAPSRAVVTDTVMRNNGGFGAVVGGQGDTTLHNVRATSNTKAGLQFLGTQIASLSRAYVANNIGGGVEIRANLPTESGIIAISDTTITDNYGFGGILATSTVPATQLRVYVTTTSVMLNWANGLWVNAVTGASTLLTFSDGTIAHTGIGLLVQGTGTVTGVVSGTRIMSTGTGLRQEDTAILLSRGDNVIGNTTTPTFGTITPLPSY
jgi:hypothetical protein